MAHRPCEGCERKDEGKLVEPLQVAHFLLRAGKQRAIICPFMHPVPLARLLVVGLTLAAALVPPPPAHAQSTVIPLTTRRDMVFDASGKYLYITTSDGWVRPYNLETKTLEPGYNLGGSLNGIDIAPGDSFLLIAQQNPTGSEGTIHRLDLTTGVVTDIHFTLDSSYSEQGAWDVAITANGRALVTTIGGSSGNPTLPLRQIDLANNSISVRRDIKTGSFRSYISANTPIHRSADWTRVLVMETGNRPVFYTYDAAADTFGSAVESQTYTVPSTAAVNRDGSLIATRRDEFASIDSASDLSFRHSFSGVDSGVAFDAVRDLFYVINRTTGQIVGYDTNTFAEKFRLAIGENFPAVLPWDMTQGQFNTGTLVASQDGRYLALETPNGIRLIPIPSTPLPPQPPIFGRPRDMVFSHSGKYLYITTATGLVWPFNLSTNSLEPAYHVGGSLNAVDIAPDDSFLLIAQANTALGGGIVHKLDLANRSVTQLFYPTARVSYENGTWDLAIGANNIALISTILGVDGYSGWVPLRQIDLATNVTSIRVDAPGSSAPKVTGNTIIDRSADRTRLLLREPNDSRGPIFTYSATTNSFGPQFQNFNFNEYLNSAVTRDGSHMIIRFEAESVMDTLPDFSFGHRWSGAFDSGVAFSAVDDLLFAVKSSSDEIIAYDTNTFTERFRVAIGEDVPWTPHRSQNPGDPPGDAQFTTGTLVASQDGRYLALIAPTSLRVIDLATGTSTHLPTTTRLGNISTRAYVGTGVEVPIGGFIVTGTDPKKVMLRALGPSLTPLGVAGAVQDPILELHDASGNIITLNDSWKASQESEIAQAGLAPADDREAGIMATLAPGSYTAVVRGKNDTTGIGLVEVYDLDSLSNSKLANISTRGIVGTGDNAMIAGVIVSTRGGNVGGRAKYMIRGLGPSLSQFQIPNPISDPDLWIYNGQGSRIAYNGDWKDTHRIEIQNAGFAPRHDKECAEFVELEPGNYTAILRNGTGATGVGLVEVYELN